MVRQRPNGVSTISGNNIRSFPAVLVARKPLVIVRVARKHCVWPDAGFGAGSIEYTLGLCFNIGGQWYCSAPIQFWYGRDLAAAAAPSSVHTTWFYDARWGPMNGYQPANGELVAIWAGEGNLRNSGNTYMQRTNFVVVPWDNGNDSTYTFLKGLLLRPFRR